MKTPEAKLAQVAAYKVAHPERVAATYQKVVGRRYRLLASLKLSAGCLDCGYNRRHEAIDFDHVRGGKIEEVSSMVQSGRAWGLIWAEVEKCDVVCANCHRVRTAERFQQRKETA